MHAIRNKDTTVICVFMSARMSKPLIAIQVFSTHRFTLEYIIFIILSWFPEMKLLVELEVDIRIHKNETHFLSIYAQTVGFYFGWHVVY